MMLSQLNASVPHVLAIVLIVAGLCIFLASCIRFFFRDMAWKSAKARDDQMDLEPTRSHGKENNNAAIGCVGILASLLLAGVGIALIGNPSTPSPESMQGIVNGTKMYPDVPRKHHSKAPNSGIMQGSKTPVPSKKKK